LKLTSKFLFLPVFSYPLTKITEKSKGKRNLKDIYNEFWEFINDNNVDFKEFIEKDKRSIKLKLGIN